MQEPLTVKVEGKGEKGRVAGEAAEAEGGHQGEEGRTGGEAEGEGTHLD